ncbi:tRNA (N(6)-L-threonylcarbamoyladenosine(37)-C(2))-methylthiotransferase MtaB [Bacteroidia bacterium]|nr:tRNA (N(6)-L-threonylcarbamoyladenosine(37)-C(2))-methylthiotransferase MtaB [Bacteroidia bacterium]
MGCKLNFAESAAIAQGLCAIGLQEVPAKDVADVCIINTCAVTQVAEKKSRQIIQRITRQNPQELVVLTGCYAQLQAQLLQTMVPTGIVANKKEVVQQIAQHFGIASAKQGTAFFVAHSLGHRTRSFLKVQDGCDYHCTYCTVARARGASQNPPIATLLEQAKTIAASGIKEIILTGVNIGDFGKSTGETLLQLIRQLEAVQGIERYRISSIEPNLLSNEMIDFVAASPKFLPHFHIPLQSPASRILQVMQRRYTADLFAAKIACILQKIPQAFIGIDVIAGFPTETDEEFRAGVEYLKALQVAYLHVFPYSKRPHTPAIELPQVPQHTITQRTAQLNALCQTLHRDFYHKHLHSTAAVLFEGSNKNGTMTGFTENYIKVEMPYNTACINRIVPVQLCAIADNGNVVGSIVES